MKKPLLAMVGALAATASMAATVSVSDGVCTVNVPDGEDYTLTSADITTLASYDLEKTGGGRLIISTSISSYTGEIRVKEGFLKVMANGALGASSAGTIVSDGATLEVGATASTANKLNFQAEPITISGNGVDGKGALNNAYSHDYTSWGKVTLAADAGVGGVSRHDLRGSTFNMNGHTLTVRGYFALTSETVTNPGRIHVLSNDVYGATSTFVFESIVKLNGGEENVVSLGEGTCLNLQGTRVDLPWTLVASNNCTAFNATNGGATNRNVWAGPVQLVSGDVKIQPRPAYPIMVSGTISGAGRLVHNNEGEVYLRALDNSFTGGLKLNATKSTCWVYGLIPGYDTAGKVHLSGRGARLFVHVGDGTNGGWTADQYLALAGAFAQGSDGNATVAAFNDEGETLILDGAYSACVGHAGEGRMDLTGSLGPWCNIANYGGELNVTGQALVHFADFAGGTTTIGDGGYLYYRTNACVGATWPDVARLVVDGGTYCQTNVSSAVAKAVYGTMVGTSQAYKSATPSNQRGILELKRGIMTNRVNLANVQYGYSTVGYSNAGALYVKGGFWDSRGTGNSCDMYVGSSGSGYVEISGGTTKIPGWTMVGAGTGRGVWVQTGGKVSVAGTSLSFGQGSARATGYFSGGSMTSNYEVILGKCTWSYESTGAKSDFTVDGTAELSVGGAMDMCMASNHVAVLNLNGGVLATPFIQKTTNLLNAVSTSGTKDMSFNTGEAYVNFNGGTLKSKASGELFKLPPDRVTVYSGGATFDTDGYSSTVSVPLVAPSGNGIASIASPASFNTEWNYIGSPHVEITGDGSGASAYAEFDSESGLVTGIKVTSPGCGYTTASAVISRCGWTNTVTITPTLAAFDAGGITKKGLGMLTLNATNSFSGPVTVSGGTLRAGTDRAFPTSAFDLTIDGGTFDGGGYAWNFGAITATSGFMANVDSATATSLVKTGDGTLYVDNPIEVSGTVRVEGGTLALPYVGAGLWEGANSWSTSTERGDEWNTKPEFRDSVATNFTYFHVNHANSHLWTSNMNVTYSGVLWNRAETNVTWSFAGVLDDGIALYIDKEEVFSARSWTTPQFGTVTLEPGPHSFYVIAYNGSGGAGATGCGSYYEWPACHGLVWDQQGRASSNFTDYVDLEIPSDGSLFTLTKFEAGSLKQFPSVEVAAGATLCVYDGIYAFNTYTGLGNIDGSTTVTNWVVDATTITNWCSAASQATNEMMHVTGGITFGDNATLTVVNADQLPEKGSNSMLLRAEGAVSGAVPKLVFSDDVSLRSWHLEVSDHEVKLLYQTGTLLILR